MPKGENSATSFQLMRLAFVTTDESIAPMDESVVKTSWSQGGIVMYLWRGFLMHF
jgi:hypothetical protein